MVGSYPNGVALDGFLLRWRNWLPYLLVLPLLLALPDSGWLEETFGEATEIGWDVFSAAIAFAGLAIRMAVAGFGHEEPGRDGRDPLRTRGAYSIIRHPRYLSDIIVLLGLALSVKVWWVVLLVLAVSVLFYARVIRAEEATLTDKFGAEFTAWCATTPAIVPDFSLWRAGAAPFSWHRAIRREHNVFFKIVVALTAIEFATDEVGENQSLPDFVAEDVYWLWFLAAGTIVWGVLRARFSAMSARLRFWLRCIVVFLAVESADRVFVLAWTIASGTIFTHEMMAAVPIGALSDLAAGLSLGAPFLAGLYLLAGTLRRRFVAPAAHVLLLAMLGVMVFAEVAEILFWNEFDSRFNSIAVSYLIFPREVIGNIRESFNLWQLLPVVGLCALGLYLLLRQALARALAESLSSGERRHGLLLSVGSLAVGVGALWLNPADLFLDRTINEATKNGYHSFIEAALTNDQRYEGVYLSLPENEARPLVRSMVAQDNTTFLHPESEASLMRHVDNGTLPRKLNVVMILNESFGSTYVDGLDNNRAESISPRLTRLAQDGLFFTNVYATGNRTVRALEAVFTSFPPIPGVSTARRSGSEGMNSLPTLLSQQGYNTAFLYAGRAVFDNMGHFWSTVGFDQVWEQSDIDDQGFTTVWGSADEYLYGEALKRLDTLAADGKPMFLSLLTVSNHRPYTYPAGRIDKDPARQRRESAATYADWAFGEFIDKARGHAWFRDTVFVFMGDHGPRVYGAAQVPVPSYRVPVLFYSPAHIRPERNGVLGSNMDVAPTLMGLLGISYDSPFFGVDLRRVPAGGGRIAMEHNFSVAVGDGKEVAMILPGRGQRGYEMQIGPHELKPTAEADPNMLRRAVALIQTAHQMFYQHEYHELAGAGR